MKTTYKVTAATGFMGHQLGDEFDAELTEDQERRAKERGSIRVVRRGDSAKSAKQEEDASDG